MRLDSFLASAGISSRRKAKEIIKEGNIFVDDKKIIDPGYAVDPGKNSVYYNGRKLKQEKLRYFLLYKPIGYVTTLHDPQNRPTVVSLLPKIKERVFPVGRLDYNTEGLLLMTNDGQLAFRLSHPKFETEKEYVVHIKGKLLPKHIICLERGVQLEDGRTSPAKIKKNKYYALKGYSSITIVIHEGKKRQIRRMFKKIGYTVIFLKRTRLSFLSLKGLKPGKARELTDKEVKRLRREVSLC